jgi:flagellar biosynthesis/type III secretory pathway protein FliH
LALTNDNNLEILNTMKKIIRIELNENVAETIATLIICITTVIVLSLIEMKKSKTIENIEQRLEQIENTKDGN